jgi:hypothetical protein
MAIELELEVSRHEADVDGFFLANRNAATLGTAVARSATDLHLSGCETSIGKLLTTLDTGVSMRVPASCERIDNELRIPSDIRLNVTTSRIGLAIDGTVCTTLSGQGSISLKDVVEASAKSRSATTACTYASWANIGSYIVCSNATFRDADTGAVLTAVFVDEDADSDETKAAVEETLKAIYDASAKLRTIVVYQPAPPLSKPVMKTPVGIAESTYDLSVNVVDRPTSLSREAFESMAVACMAMELKLDHGKVKLFLEETQSPSVGASKWSEHVANAMSAMVCYVMPYRVDGATAVNPTGLEMISAESWKAEAQRDCMNADDCDGSAAWITSSLYEAAIVARDSDASKKFPFTAAFSNAMVHHAVGLCVLAANAGSADQAGANGHAAIAGHAIAMAVPKAALAKAKVVAMIASGGFGNAMSDEQKTLIENTKGPFLESMYPPDDISRMPEEEAALVADTDAMLESFLSTNGHIIPLAMEGTSPVHSSKLREDSSQARLEQVALNQKERILTESLGPTLARTFSRLHVPSSSSGPPHAFYKDFVEFLLPARTGGPFKNQSLRDYKQASSHFVFASSQNILKAGVNTEDMASHDFSIVPLWKLDNEAAQVMDASIDRSHMHTMTRREGPTILDERESGIYRQNIDLLKKVAVNKPVNSSINYSTEVRQIVPLAAVSRNEGGVAHLASALEKTADVSAVAVNVLEVKNILHSHKGADIGALVEIRIYSQ